MLWCHPQHKAKLISISIESRSQFILGGNSLPQTKLWVLQSSCYAEHKDIILSVNNVSEIKLSSIYFFILFEINVETRGERLLCCATVKLAVLLCDG